MTWPIVIVAQPVGPPRLAEERDRKPSSNPERPELVKVVYLGTRTCTWISAERVIEEGGTK